MRPQIPAVLSTLPSPTWASPLIAQSSTALLPGHVTEPFATTRELVSPKHRGEQRSALSSAGGLALPASVGVSPSLRGNAILSVYFETTSHTPCRSLSVNNRLQGSAQVTRGSSSSSGDSKVSGRVNTMSAPGIPAGARYQYPAFPFCYGPLPNKKTAFPTVSLCIAQDRMGISGFRIILHPSVSHKGGFI